MTPILTMLMIRFDTAQLFQEFPMVQYILIETGRHKYR